MLQVLCLYLATMKAQGALLSSAAPTFAVSPERAQVHSEGAGGGAGPDLESGSEALPHPEQPFQEDRCVCVGAIPPTGT